jgi:predicted transcriptional regulator
MEILEVLWSLNSATVREVHEALQPARQTGYTTVLKLMQIMASKGLLARDESQRSHVYTPTVARESVQRTVLGEVIDRAFRGSTSAMVMHALSSRRASADELAQIRDLIDQLEDEGEDAL